LPSLPTLYKNIDRLNRHRVYLDRVYRLPAIRCCVGRRTSPRGIGASRRWLVRTIPRCGVPSSRCGRMRLRRRRHCCRMHVASRRPSVSRTRHRLCSASCTRSVQHDEMERKRSRRPCVRSHTQSALSDTLLRTLLRTDYCISSSF